MRIGAQLYTARLHTQTESDFDTTIKKVAGMGYTCVQVSGIGNIPVEKVRAICDKHGIEIIVTHAKPERVLNDTENVINEHKILGANYIGIGALPTEYRENLQSIQKFIKDYTTPAKKMREAGMKFMYHNHKFEFIKYDGKLMLDHLADGFSSDLMGLILDTYWIQAGGGDPAFYIRKYSGRVDTIHLKDMAVLAIPGEHREIQVMSEVLEGNLNWPEIFKACKEAGVKYSFVEQDDEHMGDPFECLALSYTNLVKAGYK